MPTATQNFGSELTFRSATDLASGRRVKITGAAATSDDAPLVGYADADDAEWIGTTVAATVAGDPATVRLRNATGTTLIEVTGAIGAGALVKAATNGRGAAAGTVDVGIAHGVSTASGDLLEVQSL